jgi:hypothetical protein
MPSDHGRRFDEYQGIEELRPYSVEPHPEQTVGQEESKAAGAPRTITWCRKAISSSSSDARLRTRNESRETRVDRIEIMHPDGMAVVPEIPGRETRSTSRVRCFAAYRWPVTPPAILLRKIRDASRHLRRTCRVLRRSDSSNRRRTCLRGRLRSKRERLNPNDRRPAH